MNGNVRIIDKGALKEVAKIVGDRLHEFGDLVTELARENTREFKGHKNPDPKKRPTGTLGRSIEATKTGEHSLTIQTRCGYGAYVELGTRRMAAQPFLAPAFEQAIKEMAKGSKWA